MICTCYYNVVFILNDTGDGWLLSSLAAVVGSHRYRIWLDPNQDISKNGPGVVYVEIWKFGKWTEIVVDDWVSFLGKTFAKYGKSEYILIGTKCIFYIKIPY